MRLLERNSDGEFSLTKDLGDDIPRYAILSHTWGADTEEVTYKDIMENTGKSKTGYNKIQFCGEQAKSDGLQYFWIDTCCIDKSNFTELAEAINSMFRWYQNAVKCYVYLSDVSISKRKASSEFLDLAWEPAFQSSRWFTRGWTLQELLAPSAVEFFSREGKQLGDKKTLEQQISKITGIAIAALQGVPLFQFGIEERFLWAEKRQTTRKEDRAYSLLGIFDVYIPLFYGEGSDNAFSRLRNKIDKLSKWLGNLPYAIEAPFNSYAKQHLPSCFPDTRVELLQDIYAWADGQDEQCIFWLNGMAGTGKSTIARTIARKFYDQGRLGASFFFAKGGGDVSNARKFFTSIARQLANKSIIRRSICEAIMKHEEIANQTLSDQWNYLIRRPLSNLKTCLFEPSLLLVIDALDECESENDIQGIIRLLGEAKLLNMVKLRVFITSRPEVSIRNGFYDVPQTTHQDFVLHNIPPKTVTHDISIFLKYNLEKIGRKHKLATNWPGEAAVKCLTNKACGLFIWAATACLFIDKGNRLVTQRLSDLLKDNISVTAPEQNLNEIYLAVLRSSIGNEYSELEKLELYKTLRLILGTITIVFSPLSATSLAKLLYVAQVDVEETLVDLHSILNISEGPDNLIHLHHPSFRDFLLDRQRCSDSNFWVNEMEIHRALAENCIQLMSSSMKTDMCSLRAPGTLTSEVDSSKIEQYLPVELQYASRYWIQHLHRSNPSLHDNDLVHNFLRKHLLHWFEVLSLIGRISDGILGLTMLLSMAKPYGSLHAILNDAKRFIFNCRSAIDLAPLQIYYSTLIFAPEMSLVRELYLDQIPTWICKLPRIQEGWTSSLQVIDGHTENVFAVAFSPDGQLLATASADTTIKLWDVVTGTFRGVLEGHSNSVWDVKFSLDGHLLASRSDETVIIWDAPTGVLRHTLVHPNAIVNPDALEGPRDPLINLEKSVTSLAFSLDSHHLVCGYHGGNIIIWDTKMGTQYLVLNGHLNSTDYSTQKADYSPNGQILAASSRDNTVKLWDPLTGAVRNFFEGYTDFAFLPDGQLFALVSKDGIVRIQHLMTEALHLVIEGSGSKMILAPDGSLLATIAHKTEAPSEIKVWNSLNGALDFSFEASWSLEQTITFSPDSQLLASRSQDREIKIWNARTGELYRTLEDHVDLIRMVAFSPDSQFLASASDDTTARVWDITADMPNRAIQGHSANINIVEFSPDGKLLASGAQDGTVGIWNVLTGLLCHMLTGHSSYVTTIGFSPKTELLASGSMDKTIRLWNTATGRLYQIIRAAHLDRVHEVVFSPDGRLLASISSKARYNTPTDYAIRLWDPITGELRRCLKGHLGSINSLVFSPDSRLLASGSFDSTTRIWDTWTGALRGIFEGQPETHIWKVVFSPNANLIASISSQVKIWNIQSKELLAELDYKEAVHELSNSTNKLYLNTKNGAQDFSCIYDPTFQSASKPTEYLYVKDDWVACNGEKILWLPPNYRSLEFWELPIASWKKMLALGDRSGRVTIIRLCNDKHDLNSVFDEVNPRETS